MIKMTRKAKNEPEKKKPSRLAGLRTPQEFTWFRYQVWR